MIPTDAPASAAARAARWPASPAPITKTSCCGIGARVYVSGGGTPAEGANEGPSSLNRDMRGSIDGGPRRSASRRARAAAARGRERAQLTALGLGEDAIDWRVRRAAPSCTGACTPVGHLNLTRNGRFMAAVLACGDGQRSATSVLPFSGGCSTIGEADPRDGGTAQASGRGSCCTRPRWAMRGRRGLGILGHHARADARRPRRRRPAPHARAGHRRGGVPAPRLHRARPPHGRSGSGRLSSVLAVHAPGSTRTRSELEELFLALCDNHGSRAPR